MSWQARVGPLVKPVKPSTLNPKPSGHASVKPVKPQYTALRKAVVK